MAPITIVDKGTVIESGETTFNSEEAGCYHLFKVA
jgi:hypothetical protein